MCLDRQVAAVTVVTMRIALPLAALAMAATACSGSTPPKKVALAATPSPTPVATTPAPAPVTTTDLLTGLSPRSTGSLVAVKIDNAPLARPYQKGLGKAAVVYQELAEGGLTRFLAVYETSTIGSNEVGPVRSARESDIELLRAFGKIPLAFSGAQDGVVNLFLAAQRKGWLLDGSYDTVTSAYRLAEKRIDARNFYVSPTALAAKRAGNGAVDIGLRFGVPSGGIPTTSGVASFSPDSRVGLTYQPAGKTWALTQNGRPMAGVAPTTVIVQRVREATSSFRDVHGLTTPYTTTTGSGAAVVFTNGQRQAATWTRLDHGTTRYRNAAGKDVLLQPGPVWILLVPTTGSVTFG
jgi:hypothetical protein